MPPRTVRPLFSFLLLVLPAACGGGSTSTPPPATPSRTWRMGMATTPPVLTTQSVLDGIAVWADDVELAAFHAELPWTDLLNGMAPAAILQRDHVLLVDYLRQRGLGIAFMIDLTDGLSRADEAPQLVALSRSLTEPAVQQLARDYALAVATTLTPELMGLAAETNLIRSIASPALYQAVVTTSNAIAADLAAAHVSTTTFVSVQVETAWGLLPAGPFVGITQDVADFPLVDAIGLSSYPYFAFATPDDIPVDYYTRVAAATNKPILVSEGGWTSASVGSVTSTPQQQVRYLERQAELLDSVAATAWLHLLFADPDLATWPQPTPPTLPLFTSIGFTDSSFAPKPAFAVWRDLVARPLLP
ncbi:MAG: hypothetical protein K8J09_14930 [Planctomycetes bacterium]|nr:hypothetical protein [Planctomycetota bacterium]MCC7395529.1 hypothetical protein [Planctomycetota bacterium]